MLRRRNGGYSLQYREKSSSSKCTGNDRIFIKRRGSRLFWRGTASSGQVGEALLRRACYFDAPGASPRTTLPSSSTRAGTGLSSIRTLNEPSVRPPEAASRGR